MRRLFLLGSLMLASVAAFAQAAQSPESARQLDEPLQITTSFRPLALLAQDVAGELADVEVLLPAGASPHHYSLRMSDVQQLQNADLFVWIGPEFERFLDKPLASRDPQSVLTASTLTGLQWPESRHAGHGEHGHGNQDMHLWLNPDNAVVIMEALAKRLTQLQPDQAATVRKNLHRAKAELEQVKRAVSDDLEAVRRRGFAVSHDGFAHFVQAFHLNQIAAISVMPDQALGARQIMQLKDALAPANCLVVEAGETQDAVAGWKRLFQLPVVAADPLAIDPAIASYPALLAELGSSFVSCLSPAR